MNGLVDEPGAVVASDDFNALIDELAGEGAAPDPLAAIEGAVPEAGPEEPQSRAAPKTRSPSRA